MTTINKLKTLYVYTVPVKKEVEESIEKKDENGATVKEIRKVTKTTTRRLALRKPTRQLIDNAELYFNVLVSQGIQAGLMSRALLAKRFNNDGGVMSNPEKQAYAKGYFELEEKERALAKMLLNGSNLSEEGEKQREVLSKEIGLLKRQLQDMELSQISLYDITAESRARTKTILWWVLFLTYVEKDGEEDVWQPLFNGESFEEKMDDYDMREESETIAPEEKEFYSQATRQAAAATAFWFYGRATKQEDFKSLETEISSVVPAKQTEPVKTEQPSS